MHLYKHKKLIIILPVFLCTFIFSAYANCAPASQKLPLLEEVIILSAQAGSMPTNTNKLVSYNDKITLYALLKCREGYYFGYEGINFPDKVQVYDTVYSLEQGSLERWKKNLWGELHIEWYQVLPKVAPSRPAGHYPHYSNVFSGEDGEDGKWRGWQIIEYEQLALSEQGWNLNLKKEPGTFRFRAEVTLDGKTVTSPGKPDPAHPSGLSAEDYDRGIKHTVHRVSRRSNHQNKLISYIEALKGVPWLWGAEYRDAAQKNPSSHQSDFYNPVGIECSSILISALRAMGNEQLEYTTAKNLAAGRYTIPLLDVALTYSRRSFFKNWVPRGIIWSRQDKLYVYDTQRIRIKDPKFNLLQEITAAGFEIIDIAVCQEETIYAIIEKDFQSRIVIIENTGVFKEIFTPEVQKTILIGEEEYLCNVTINPSAIAVVDVKTGETEEKRIYLLDSDIIRIFDLQGKELEYIPLKGAFSDWYPSGYLTVHQELFYIPTHNKKVLVFSNAGEIVNTINLDEEIMGIDIKEEKIIVLHPFPLRVQIYNLDGSFYQDLTDRFLDEKGEELTIGIGPASKELQIGDLMITTHPTSHLLLLYEDNGNNLLDSKDKIICAGHQGIEIREVSYFEGRKFSLRRVAPNMEM